MGWGGRSSKRGGGGDSGSGNFSGCMTAFFHFFDFHQHQLNFSLHRQPPFMLEEPAVLKGVEAPRNSLDLEISKPIKQENLNINMGHIQIRTNGATRPTPNDSSSELSYSPGTKTPTLVARLMGLDVLPDCSSPALNSNLPRRNQPRKSLDSSNYNVSGTRSLPETPRISSAKRSDVDHHHRFSLQINNKENTTREDMDISRFSSTRKREAKDDYYARQIVKQVKESVSRRVVGLDITNTVRKREQRRDDELLLKSKKNSSKTLARVVEQSTPPSSSPRLSRFLEPKTIQVSQPPKPRVNNVNELLLQHIKVPRPKSQQLQDQQQQEYKQQKCRIKKPPPQKCDIIRNKQEETFVHLSPTLVAPEKKCKKTPLSNQLLNNISVPLKKDPSPKPTKVLPKQVLGCLSQSYKQDERKHLHISRGSNHFNGATTTTTAAETTGKEAEEYEYIARIVRRTGIYEDTLVSSTRWFSPSHPLDPSIFYYLEHFTATTKGFCSCNQLNHRCNRKLLFHLVDELVAQILKPYINVKPWVVRLVEVEDYSIMQGSQLMDTLCKKIDNFPGKDCRVLEDIDALVDSDLQETKVQSEIAFEEEGEGIVIEIVEKVLDTLVREMLFD